MSLDVFALRDRVVGEYRDYFESFVRILDERIDGFVRDSLRDGELWPDAVLQLNPAYERGQTLGELANQGLIARETARFFGPNLRLHRHQEEALGIAQCSEPYIVSTGTGSGKSLTYLLPIVDHVFRHNPDRPTVRAVIVYPMNALVNSQIDALEHFKRENWPDSPLHFARYTGQERDAEREAIINNPPHILLTNYVMLEYMLLRPHERTLLRTATKELSFLVIDELHVYRGRQGADVAMLTRRVRQKAGQDIQLVGTSATIATGGSRDDRQARIADVGSTLFGVRVPAANVVDETLQRIAAVAVPRTQAELRTAVQLPPPAPSDAGVRNHPLAAWLEETFGLQEEDGRLIRREPVTFTDGLKRLVEASGLPTDLCRERLMAALEAGNAVRTNTGDPLFAFRLHQFLASGSSVYATIEQPDSRQLTLAGQFVAPDEDDIEEGSAGEQPKLLYPLAFCRDCGQEYYLVSRADLDGGERLLPRLPLLNAPDDELPGMYGFFAVETGDLWPEETPGDTRRLTQLPEFWFEQRKSGPKVRQRYEEHIPLELWAHPSGAVSWEPVQGAVHGWFQARPLMLCLRCRASYTLRDKSDFRKLATLSQTGRSTATTILSNAAVGGLRAAHPEDRGGNKVLSFTDNRQDASLQAGHLNDFAQITLLRGALSRALTEQDELTFSRLGPAILAALGPKPEEFMREPVDSGPGHDSARAVMVNLLTYRAFEDLRRAWRIAQPNLEQVGLLSLRYAGMEELALDDARWSDVPVLAAASGHKRWEVLQAILDHLRGLLVIDAECLQAESTRELVNRANQWLRTPWSIDRRERLRESVIARLPGIGMPEHDRDSTIGLSYRSTLGRYLRSRHTWDLPSDLSATDVDAMVLGIVAVLRGHVLTVVTKDGEDYGVQIKADVVRWQRGDGRAAGLDPVRARALHKRRLEMLSTEPNAFFSRLYQEPSRLLAGITGAEHTGQVDRETRLVREREFKAGQLAAMFCSPTMELGVDISDLGVVHMRNVPRTPANYAQRSGRAGRGGKPALVLTFASQGNAHDQYFFRRRQAMIAGSVAPNRMDLGNRELVEAHLHSVWLAAIGLSLGNSVADVLDLGQLNFPIEAEKWANLLRTTESHRSDVVAAFREITAADPTITSADWFTDEWLVQTVRDAPDALNVAFERWRDLYRAAVALRDEARRKIDLPRLPRKDRQDAERQEQEAKREVDLLLNQGDYTESDFYPYRYLATEGFLPGYNFPRLPLRVLVSVRDSAQSIDRPRFLGLSEFGPWNVIYHEGRKHRVSSCIVPPGGFDARITSARLCNECGYVHPASEGPVDLCVCCGTILDAKTSEYPQALLEQPTAKARQQERISSDEEERAREGYHITTHYRFSPGASARRAEARDASGEWSLLEIEYAPRAELWRINHGWRRSAARAGFTIDAERGRWGKREDDDLEGENGDEPGLQTVRTGVKTYVTDSRNILLLRPIAPSAQNEAFLKSLAFALQRGIQVAYQVEESEVAIELIGEGSHLRLLLWEAAEGGTGVWERMLEEPDSFAEVAKEALQVCHFDPETGEPDAEWGRRCKYACYDCLLSYSNQLEHRFLNRHLVKDYLRELATSRVQSATAGRPYDEQYRWLLDRIDPASSLEREFVAFLHAEKLRLPDFAQHRPRSDVPVQPDFYYERDGLNGVCVFVDGPHHDTPTQTAKDQELRDALADEGFRVVVIRHGRPFDEQVARYPDVFGPG
ncbi:MAG: DEAD/DEAH box helicase [Thermomicrobiales bacterium]